MMIDKGVPIPKKRAVYTRYPWHDMSPGDSLWVPEDKLRAARSAANNFVKRHRPGWCVVSRTDKTGARIWLVEEATR